MRVEPEPASDSEITRGASLGWSIAGSVTLLVVAFFVLQVGALYVSGSCWGRYDDGCDMGGVIIGWTIIAVAAVIVIAAIVLVIRAVIRFRRANDDAPLGTVEGER